MPPPPLFFHTEKQTVHLLQYPLLHIGYNIFAFMPQIFRKLTASQAPIKQLKDSVVDKSAKS